MSKKQPKLVPALAVVALVVVLAYFVTDVSIWWLLGAGLVGLAVLHWQVAAPARAAA